MIEAKGNMWNDPNPDAFVITTNGFVKNNGQAVMGRGCAKEAVQYWPQFPLWLGTQLKTNGNHVYFFYALPWKKNPGKAISVFSFPVKHNWYEKADIDLIHQSCIELVEDVEFWSQGENNPYKLNRIVMPRPGCGNGKLDWNKIKPILLKYLDDRFIVYDY